MPFLGIAEGKHRKESTLFRSSALFHTHSKLDAQLQWMELSLFIVITIITLKMATCARREESFPMKHRSEEAIISIFTTR